jgi:hypothetical protein
MDDIRCQIVQGLEVEKRITDRSFEGKRYSILEFDTGKRFEDLLPQPGTMEAKADISNAIDDGRSEGRRCSRVPLCYDDVGKQKIAGTQRPGLADQIACSQSTFIVAKVVNDIVCDFWREPGFHEFAAHQTD